MTTPRSPIRRRAALADLGLLYAAAIWGSTFILVKRALDGIDPVVLVAYRFLLAGNILLVWLALKRAPVTRDLGKGLFLSIVLATLYIPQTIGLGITTASNSGFITGLFVAFVPLFLRTIFKRTPTLMEVIASAVALAGLWILTGGLVDMNTGDILTLLAAITYALHLLYSDRYMKAGVDPFVISCQQFLFVGLIALVMAFALDLPLTVSSRSTGGIIVFLAFFPTLLAFVIQMLVQKFTSPLRVSLIFALEPVFAAVFAWTLGGESFVLRSAAGGLLIMAALILSGLPTPGRKTRHLDESTSGTQTGS